MTIHTSSPARLHNKIQTKPDAKANTCSIHIAALPAAASTIDCVHSWQPLEMSCITEDVSIEEDYSRANAIDENEEKEIRFSLSLPLLSVFLPCNTERTHRSCTLFFLSSFPFNKLQKPIGHWLKTVLAVSPRNPGALSDNRRVLVVAIQTWEPAYPGSGSHGQRRRIRDQHWAARV